jgi:hypothetical protein
MNLWANILLQSAAMMGAAIYLFMQHSNKPSWRRVAWFTAGSTITFNAWVEYQTEERWHSFLQKNEPPVMNDCWEGWIVYKLVAEDQRTWWGE